MDRFKADCRFHIKDLFSIACWMYAIELTLIIIGVLVSALMPNVDINTENEVPAVGLNVSASVPADGFAVDETYMVVEDEEFVYSAVTMNFSGMEATSWITFLIAGIACSWIWLKTSMANCIPRKKEFLSALTSIAVFAVFLVAGNYFINFICEIISDKAYYGAWDLMFGMNNDRGRLLEGGEKFLYHFAGVIFNYICIVSYFIAGYFIGMLYYRMNTMLKIAVSVGVPVLIFIGIPLLTYFMMSAGVWEKSLFYELGYKLVQISIIISNSMGLTILENFAEFLVCAGLSFLLIRKAPVK